MGSKFHEFLQPTATRDRDLAGQAVAVDGSAWLHQFLKVTRHDPNDPGNRLVLVDKTYRLINHLRGFLSLASSTTSAGSFAAVSSDGCCGHGTLARE
jgi:5'-3' exonuclease